ncbi:MAG: HAD-IIB family hydrolase [Verrucomicrobia bacterium]|nr:HAD-IIB family hydrolase [Verrucomicrobiota bacterium]
MPATPPDPAPPLVVFTDLDGTLLDARTYEAGVARDALAALAQRGVPVVFCSSKTAAEQRPLRAALGLPPAPFIVENGSACFVPDATGTEHVHVLGRPAADVRAGLHRAAATAGLRVTGYADLSVAAVAARTGLDVAAAERAGRRDFSETLVDEFPPAAWARLEVALAAEGLCARHGGRFRTVTGAGADKGRAVRLVAERFRAAAGRTVPTAGLGDSANDESLLAAVDRAFLLGAGPNPWSPDLPGLRRIATGGPAGWCEAIAELLAGLPVRHD